jgi:putative flippase GtrA
VIAARALVVGLACALLHNAIVILGAFAGVHYAVSLTISFAIVVIVGYWLHSGWTFRGTKRGASSFARYVFVASANYPASLAGMFVLVDLMGMPVPLASPLLTIVLFAVNFLGNRWALQRGSSNRHT